MSRRGIEHSEPKSTKATVVASSSERTILAIDYGRARIGLAIANVENGLARPLETLQRVNRNEDMRRLRQIIRDHSVKQIVVGLPLRLDGTHGEMAEEAGRFAARVRKQFGLPVELVDERLTSWEAKRLLEERSGRVLRAEQSGHKKRPRDKAISVDSVAATVILQDYLAQGHATKRPPEHI